MMTSAPKISIVIVNYNTTGHVRKCLNSIKRHLNSAFVETIVVDNNSTDRSIEDLLMQFNDVVFLFRDKNDGFGNGCNAGVELSKSEYLLFMNPDVELLDDSVELLMKHLEMDDHTGAVSGVMKNESGDPIYFYNCFPSLKWELFQILGFGFDREINRLISRSEIAEKKTFEVDWFHGAFIMMRKSDFNAAGKFNEQYFMYYEDVELCYKIRNSLNKQILCLPQVSYFHETKSSVSGESLDNIYTFHLSRSKLLFIRNYSIVKRALMYSTGLVYVISRIVVLPVWRKYKGKKMIKAVQLLKIMKLYLNKEYLENSKFEYISA